MNRDLILKYFVEYLKDRVELKLLSLNLCEDRDHANITLKLQHNSEECEFSGQGVGVVDAGLMLLFKTTVIRTSL